MKPGESLRTSGFPARNRLISLALLLASCNGGGNVADTSGPKGDFPVDESIAAVLAAKGLPADAARWLASAKLEAAGPEKGSYRFLQTFPNGATREIAFKIESGIRYTRSAAESARTDIGAEAGYGVAFGRTAAPDSTVNIALSYFIPEADVPEALRKNASGFRKGAAESGSGVSVGETAKAGADVAIGSVLDYYKDKGLPVKGLGNLYSLASALSAIGGAAALSQQNTKWLKELGDLEDCAANPTNPVAKSDPDYIKTAVGKVQSARRELQEVNTVRFLNQMTETGAGATPASAALAAALKEGFIYNEKTLENYSEETIMREARLAVDSCKDEGTLAGNVDVVWDCTITGPYQTDVTLAHTVSAATWTFDPASRMYVAQGGFTHKSVKTTTGGGKTCTYTITAQGSIAGSGSLIVIDDIALQNVLGYGYSASGQISVTGQWVESCLGTSGTLPLTIDWLPNVTGFPGTGGSMEGERSNPTCIGSDGPGGAEKTKFAFSVPPPE